MATVLSDDGGQVIAIGIRGLGGPIYSAAATTSSVPVFSSNTADGVVAIDANNIPFLNTHYDIMVVSNGAGAGREVLLPDSQTVPVGTIIGILNTAVTAGTCQARNSADSANVGPVIPGIAGTNVSGGGLFFINVRTDNENGFQPINSLGL